MEHDVFDDVLVEKPLAILQCYQRQDACSHGEQPKEPMVRHIQHSTKSRTSEVGDWDRTIGPGDRWKRR